MLVSASDDNTICLWDPTTGQCLQTLEGHNGWVQSVAFQPDGKMLVSVSDDNTIHLWDPTTGQCLQTLEGRNDLDSLSFVNNHPYLNTSRGFIRFDSHILEDLQSNQPPPHALYIANSWVTSHTLNFLWIPSDYRAPSSTSVRNNMIALGYPSGQVISLIF